MNADAKSHSAQVNGLRMYYEVHGNGAPLILLHGSVTGIVGIQALLPRLAARRRVFAVELQAHGRTSDKEGPLSFEGMAEDVVGLMAEIGLQQADWMGYSLGGGVALHAALRHPARVRKLVLVSIPFARSGLHPEVRDGIAWVLVSPEAAERMKGSPLAQTYPNVDWGVLFAKLRDLFATDYDLSREVAAITAPTMIAFADADLARPEHIVEFFHLLGGGLARSSIDPSQRPAARLAILPGFAHDDICNSPALPSFVDDFLG
jgi:pimeloyl-ACP methyl ester carboxylesterase